MSRHTDIFIGELWLAIPHAYSPSASRRPPISLYQRAAELHIMMVAREIQIRPHDAAALLGQAEKTP